MNFKHPFFWRHFAAYTLGAWGIVIGLAVTRPRTGSAPLTDAIVVAGAWLLAVAGTPILGRPPAGPPAEPALASSERPTPPSGPAKAA